MSIDDAIKLLRKTKAQGVKHIVLAFWVAEHFEHEDNNKWAGIAEYIEDEMDWSMSHDQMTDLINQADL